MKKRDYARLSKSMARFAEEIDIENKQRFKKLQELEKQKIDYNVFTPAFLVMLADIYKDYKKIDFERLIDASAEEGREMRELMKNAEERLSIIEEAEGMGLEVSNEDFEKGIYDFVASAENIEFEKDDYMTEIIEKLESKYSDTTKEIEHEEVEENEA